MNQAEEKILTDAFGPRQPSFLEAELFFILKPHLRRCDAKSLAEKIYQHLSENVMREADLMNYEGYREHKAKENQ